MEALIYIFLMYSGQSDVYENGSSGDNNSDDWMFDMNRKSRDSDELTNPLEKSNGRWTNSSGYVHIRSNNTFIHLSKKKNYFIS